MKKITRFLLALLLVLSLSTNVIASGEIIATISNQPVELDGEVVEIGAYLIEGENYFRLRDIASILKDKSVKIDVTFDEEEKAVVIEPNGDYEILSTDLNKLTQDDQVAIENIHKLFLKDGENLKELKLRSYNINGNNYYRLRDLGPALNFGVAYNYNNGRVLINTKNPDIKDIQKEVEKPIELPKAKEDNGWLWFELIGSKSYDNVIRYFVDGEKYGQLIIFEGDYLYHLPSPNKIGYKFIGWTDKYGRLVEDELRVFDSFDLYARFIKIEEPIEPVIPVNPIDPVKPEEPIKTKEVTGEITRIYGSILLGAKIDIDGETYVITEKTRIAAGAKWADITIGVDIKIIADQNNNIQYIEIVKKALSNDSSIKTVKVLGVEAEYKASFGASAGYFITLPAGTDLSTINFEDIEIITNHPNAKTSITKLSDKKYAFTVVSENNTNAITYSLTIIVEEENPVDPKPDEPEEDTEKPVITIEPSELFYELEVGDTFTQPVATVTDNVDKDLVAKIVNNVDTTKAGEYTVTYTAVDKAGNEAEPVVVKVVVKEKPVIEYKVTYKFESSDAAKALPKEVSNLLPKASAAKYGDSVTPVYPSTTKVVVTDGSWTFDGYAPTNITLITSDQEFVGTWTFVPINEYKVSYRFESSDAAKSLPAEVTNLLPVAKTVKEGASVTPVQLSNTTVTTTDGTWTFKGYTPGEVTSITADIEFLGTWEFIANEYKVTYKFEPSVATKSLPVEVTSLLPKASTAKHGESVTPTVPSLTEVTVSDGTWTFKGYTPLEVTSIAEDTEFVGTWEFTAKPIIKEYTVTFHNQDGTSSKEKVAENSTIKTIKPTRSGFVFKGWTTVDGKDYDVTSKVTSDLDLYAKWSMEINGHPVDIVITGGEANIDLEKHDFYRDNKFSAIFELIDFEDGKVIKSYGAKDDSGEIRLGTIIINGIPDNNKKTFEVTSPSTIYLNLVSTSEMPVIPNDGLNTKPDSYVTVKFIANNGKIYDTKEYFVDPSKEVTIKAPHVYEDSSYIFDSWKDYTLKDENIVQQFSGDTIIEAVFKKVSFVALDQTDALEKAVQEFSSLPDEITFEIIEPFDSVQFGNDFANAVLDDQHENFAFYNGFKSGSSSFTDDTGKIIYKVKLDLKYKEGVTSDTRALALSKIDQWIKNNIKPTMTEEEKVRKIHDYICSESVYDLGEDRIPAGTTAKGYSVHSIESILLDEGGVCEAYAKLFQVMAVKAGLTSRYISGNSRSIVQNKLVGHAWNMVNIGGNWYNIDVTWDDGTPVIYDFYLKSDDTFEKGDQYHVWGSYPTDKDGNRIGEDYPESYFDYPVAP